LDNQYCPDTEKKFPCLYPNAALNAHIRWFENERSLVYLFRKLILVLKLFFEAIHPDQY